MNFNDLNPQEKQQLHEELLKYAHQIGGINPFLQMLEDIRAEKPKALLNKTAIFHYSSGKILWSKSIFKETLNTLYNAMVKEERDGDMIEGLTPKEHKNIMNMMRTLKPITITVQPKDENSQSFNFTILDTSIEKKTKITLLFKIIFFYNIDFAKKVLMYQKK
jgi:hypothetical protein